MRRAVRVRVLVAGGLASALTMAAGGLAWAGKEDTTSGPQLAVVSYWQPGDYAKLPAGTLALVNPRSGIVGADASVVEQFRTAVATAHARGVRFLGYVPTGYGDRVSGHDNGQGSVGQSMDDIRGQIALYASTFGSDLEGIFFDETSQDCTSAATDYPQLSAATHAAGLTRSAMNPGWVGGDYCYVKAAQAGDIVVTYENDLAHYLASGPGEQQEGARLAHTHGAFTWNLVHSAKDTGGLSQALAALRERGPDYAYVTDVGGNWQAGEDTWGGAPSYWDAETGCLTGATCSAGG